MHKIFSSYLIVGVVGLFILLTPQNIFAAQLTFKVVPNSVAGDGATVVEVRIDPQSKNLNVVEGEINFQGTASEKLSVEVETGGSVLTLWPTPSEYLPSEKTIRFTGGVPRGFNKEGLLFRVRLFSTLSGDIAISWIGGRAYLNDGMGTEEPLSARSITINLDEQSPDAIGRSSTDIEPPYFESTEIGQDPSVYDGLYFISFHATDDISGVERYEVKEGQTVTSVTDGIYVFKDQDRKTSITITAYDQAGNSKTIEISPRFGWVKNGILILLLVIILFVVFRYGYKKIIKK